MSTIPYLPADNQIDTRSPAEQYWSGFMTFIECDAAKDYLSAGELAALTPAEMAGYNGAILAADASEFAAYLANRNSFGDLTEY
jgi:hypothetical protein